MADGGFLSHIEALRKAVLEILAIFVILLIPGWSFAPDLLALLQAAATRIAEKNGGSGFEYPFAPDPSCGNGRMRSRSCRNGLSKRISKSYGSARYSGGILGCLFRSYAGDFAGSSFCDRHGLFLQLCHGSVGISDRPPRSGQQDYEYSPCRYYGQLSLFRRDFLH